MHREIDFENDIEHALISSGGYEKGDPNTYDPETALFPGDIVAFVQKTQPKIWTRLIQLDAAKAHAMLLDSLVKELAAKGALAILREGFKCVGKTVRLALAAELIETIKQCDPAFFEKLVVKLLLKMGYGGSRQEAGRAVGQSGDGGIDGIINEDRLGLDAIYLQAKRWEGSVGEGPIRDFKGALDAKGAQKGVFITTSSFTPAAKAAASNSRSYRIVLIDGARLAELMIEHDLGVSVAASYQLKRLDTDFFAED